MSHEIKELLTIDDNGNEKRLPLLQAPAFQLSPITYHPWLTIHQNGQVEIDPAFTPDEAAKLFWKAVQDMAMANSQSSRIRHLEAQLAALRQAISQERADESGIFAE